jgi:hypothetical protein
MIRTLSCLSLLAMLMLPGHAAWAALDPEDQKLIDEASCEDIQRECSAAAAFVLPGFGFFTWNDNSDAQESLAELREIRVAIAEGARKKNCRL